jgi:flagellar protein FliJ
MKSSRESLIRSKRFQVEEKRRHVAQMQIMIGEMDRMMADLDRDIENEHRKTGISDPSNFAYSTFAKAAKTRKINVLNSVEGLRAQLATAQTAFGLAQDELKKAENYDERETARETADYGASRMRRRESIYA